MRQAITGLPVSLIRKSFIEDRKRPANVPSPPPHMRIGRSVYIIRDQLADWVTTLGELSTKFSDRKPGPARPGVAQRRTRQTANDNVGTSPLPTIERSSGKPAANLSERRWV